MKYNIFLVYSDIYIINDNDFYFNDTLIIIQYPKGITFPLSVPPNFILLNSIFPTEIKDSYTSQFGNNRVIVINEESMQLIVNYLPSLIKMNNIEFYINKEAIDNRDTESFSH